MTTVSVLLRYYMSTCFKALCNVNQSAVELYSWENIQSTLLFFFFFFLFYLRGAGERSPSMILCLSMKKIICYYQLQPLKLNFGQCCCPKLSLSWQILGMFSQFSQFSQFSSLSVYFVKSRGI